MKKYMLIVIGCSVLFFSPLEGNAYTDTAISKAGITFVRDKNRPAPINGTDDRSGTFPSKGPIKRLPKTGDNNDFYFILLGVSLLLIAKKNLFKGVK
ncbi:TPA: LPXTG cell wall anchor domain-containing protein [Listeria innocua]|uniref:LPXTG cell wall anchor domain-containing protein n=1 Tax=Listeria innocua TaxID=1642 RepID=UPI00267F4913